MRLNHVWLLGAAALLSCGAPFNGQPETVASTGNYDTTYDDTVTLRLDLAGAVREVTQSG